MGIMEGNCSTCRNSQTLLVYWRHLSTTPTIVAQSTAKMKALVCLVDSASTEMVYLLVLVYLSSSLSPELPPPPPPTLGSMLGSYMKL